MRRLVLLGASNLTNGFSAVTELATAAWGPGPYRILAAAGQGRAYGVWSTVLARSLPPIADCGLWAALERQPELPTRALIADPGNDLAYGATPAQTLSAVARCLERLRRAGADTVLVLPPVASVARLAPWRFYLMRSLLFPGRRFGRATILSGLEELAAGLAGLAAGGGVRLAHPRLDWYGADGIHLRLRRRRAAWRTLLGAWPAAAGGGGLRPGVRWRFLRAERARLLSRPLHHEQPALRRADGSTASFY